MTEIPNDRYITVKRDEKGEIVVLVGGKPTTTYRGEEIYNTSFVKRVFAWMQEQNPEIEEFHIGAFATRGKYAEVGNPSGEFGPNAWCRVKKKGSSRAPWVFSSPYSSAADCANRCALRCAFIVRVYASFRSAVLGSAIDKGNTKNDNAQSVSKKPKTPKKPLVINLPWHIITIEKRKRTM
ncbi:MAG: hypothetical protein IJS34_01460 [Alphaproteobacteria bacterium]|nr:hypothetical protein [Alphaproteobacteria bacterium]